MAPADPKKLPDPKLKKIKSEFDRSIFLIGKPFAFDKLIRAAS